MQNKNRPAIDPLIAPDFGVTRDGQPLSYNRAPASDLAPWIARVYVTKVEAPPEYVLSCSLFNDVAAIRVQLAGEWTAQTATGTEYNTRAALFFGPQTHRMPITVKGSFISVGMTLRPGSCRALQGPRVGEYLDRIVSTSEVAMPSDQVIALLSDDADPEDWLTTLEGLIRRRIEVMDCPQPDPVTTMFEQIAFARPEVSVAEAARLCGVDRRRLERTVSRDFGLSPKQVLKRARALDMASALRGVADAEEADVLALRYYDESHLIHDFTELFGMSPRQFVATPQPILTLALESRQAGRLEALKRINPGESRPWE